MVDKICILVLLGLLGSCVGFGNVGVDTTGKILKNTTASSAVACASLCDLNSQCDAWSWDSCSATPSRCSLLSSATSNVLNSCRVSNAKLGEEGVDRSGQDIAGYGPYTLPASSTAAHCAQLCESTSGCVAWSFDNVGRQSCWLKSAIPVGTSLSVQRTSGIQGQLSLNTPYFGLNTWILPANSTATQCAELCFATPKCKVWLYQPPSTKCGVQNAGMCWAKSQMFYSGQADECYITGQQTISTAVAPTTSNIITPKSIVSSVPKKTFPFSRIVAFGDNLSDNGNGSYAHCVQAGTSCGNTIYGAKTWTNGPIAVSYLSTYVNASLDVDFAYGHGNGGSQFGATIDNAYTQSQANAPSAKDQIANYTNGPAAYRANLAQTLHFLWIGANDINLNHINVDSTNNSKFATEFSALMVARVQSLVNLGAKYVFVANLYPKHVSPSVTFYANTPARVANLGSAILQANNAIKNALAQFGSKVIYHDTYSFMLQVYSSSTAYGITHINGEFCDGYNQLDWELCVTDGLGDSFYWMQYLDMTSYVHNLVAADMYKTISNFF